MNWIRLQAGDSRWIARGGHVVAAADGLLIGDGVLPLHGHFLQSWPSIHGILNVLEHDPFAELAKSALTSRKWGLPVLLV